MDVAIDGRPAEAHLAAESALESVVVFAHIDEAFLARVAVPSQPAPEDELAANGVFVVLCSSMTRAQLEVTQQMLGLRQPFICEGGAAILIPHDYFPFDVPSQRELPGHLVVEFGRPHAEVNRLLRRTAARLNIPIVGFSDQSVEEVARERELSLSYARLAKLREYNEPFRLDRPSPEEHHRLWRALRAAGLCCCEHGPYEHAGAAVSLPVAIRTMRRLYSRFLKSFVTAGVGPGVDAAPLLQSVDVPFVAETCATGVTAFPFARFPRVEVGMTRAEWSETMLEVAHRTRLRPGARSFR